MQNFSSSHIRTLTVGSGITPNQPKKGSRTFTAGRESHPAPKIIYVLLYSIFLILSIVYLKIAMFFEEKDIDNIYILSYNI